MALFSKKPKTTEPKVEAPAKTNKKAVKAEIVPKEKGKVTHVTSFSHVISKPRITEKAGMLGEANVYTFEVAKTATKGKVKAAVKELYKVTPVRINIINLPRRNVFIRGRFGAQSGVKKALVFLKKGDKIEFV